jgi:hypothetical protein
MIDRLCDDYLKLLEQIKRTPQTYGFGIEYDLLGAALGIEVALERSAGVTGFLSRWNIERAKYCNHRDRHTEMPFSASDLAQSDSQVSAALTLMLDYHVKQGKECAFPLDTRLSLFAREMISHKMFMKWPIQTLFAGKGLLDMAAAYSQPRVCLYGGLTPRDAWFNARRAQHGGMGSLSPADISFDKRWTLAAELSEAQAREDQLGTIHWFEKTFRTVIVLN